MWTPEVRRTVVIRVEPIRAVATTSMGWRREKAYISESTSKMRGSSWSEDRAVWTCRALRQRGRNGGGEQGLGGAHSKVYDAVAEGPKGAS